MPETIYSWAPITKSEKQDDGTLLVYGPAATSALDRDRQRLDAGWLDAAMPRWMAEGGGVREQHDSKKAVGVGVGLSKAEDGVHMLAARIVDPVAVMKVEYGVLKGFSVGIKNPRVEMGKADAPNGLVTGGDVIEVSVVDRPANPECMFQMAKSDSGGPLALVEDPHVIEKSPTYGLPTELFERLAAPVKQALADLAASGAAVSATAEVDAETVKADAPDAMPQINVTVTQPSRPHEVHLSGWDGPIAELAVTYKSDAHGVATANADWGRRIAEAAMDIVASSDLDKAYSAEQKRQALAAGQAMPNAKGDPSYVIKTKADLRRAIKAVGHGGADHDDVRKHIITRAKALGLESMVPENWNADGSLKDAAKADAATIEKAEAVLRDVRALVPDLAKADGEDEGADIAGAQEAIAAIAKLIVSEAESLALGNLNEACDIALLLDAVRALKWFQASERAEQSGGDDAAMMLAEDADLLKADGKGNLAPPFKKKTKTGDAAQDDDAEDGDGADSEDGEDEKPAPKKKTAAKSATKADASDGEPLLTKTEAADQIKAAVAAALAETSATQNTAADPPQTVTKTELAHMVKTAVAEAKAADEERITALTADLAKAQGDLDAIKAMPVPGGPVLTRTAAQQESAMQSDSEALHAQAATLLAKADMYSANRDLAEGYRQRAKALLEKAAA